MIRRLFTLGTVVMVGILALSVWSGCGGNDDQQQQAQNLLNAMTQAASGQAGTSSDALSAQIDALKKAEMTVEIIENGKSTGKWSQGKDGSWRYESSDKSTIIIYNSEKKKSWVIGGTTAYESNTEDQSYGAFNPALMLTAFAYLPQTGGSGDTKEYSAGQSKVTIEFKGPNGLPSKVTSENTSTNTTDVTEFNYTDIGSVPSSTFELPSGVSVTTTPSAGGGAGYGSSSGGSGITVPGGGSVPAIPSP